jgi:phosphoribosylaminoimidazole (AIR) synthetase
MIVVVAADQAQKTLDHLASTGINAWQIGDIASGAGGVEFSG